MFRKEDFVVIVFFVLLGGVFLITYSSYLNLQNKFEENRYSLMVQQGMIESLKQRENQLIKVQNELLDDFTEVRTKDQTTIQEKSKEFYKVKLDYYDTINKYNNLKDEYDRMKLYLAKNLSIIHEEGKFVQGIAFPDDNFYCIYDKKESLAEQLYTVIHEWAHMRGYIHGEKMDKFMDETAQEYLKKLQK